jgi:hypothetical protein
LIPVGASAIVLNCSDRTPFDEAINRVCKTHYKRNEPTIQKETTHMLIKREQKSTRRDFQTNLILFKFIKWKNGVGSD